MSQRTYVAITTENPQHGWNEVARGSDKEQVEADARRKIGDVVTDHGTDIYRDTQHTNLRVVSKTAAKREYGVDIDRPQYDY